MRHQRQEDERQQKRVNGEVTRRPSLSRVEVYCLPFLTNNSRKTRSRKGIITTNNGKSLLDLQQSVSLDNLHIRGASHRVLDIKAEI